MADVDAELAERVARWCAEAGRQTGAAEIRRALAPLGWDDLIALRALLADPPPARPLGPFALVDLARGAPPDLAAEREREGRYPSADALAPAGGETPPPPSRPAPGQRRRPRGRKAGSVVIRRAREREAAPAPAAPAASPERLADLRRPEGRTVLERLLRKLGARRAAIAAALRDGGWRGDGGEPPREEDVAELLEHHGLARAFTRRERDEVLHALRAAGGYRPAAAARLGLDFAALEAALARLGAGQEAERIRGAGRTEVRRRATLSERLRLLLRDEDRLRDLGVLEEVEADLRARLPEHLRALRAGGVPLAESFARSLALEPGEAARVAERFGLGLERRPTATTRPRTRPSRRGNRGAAPRAGAPGRGRPPGRRRR